ncbi:aspartate aminotransferase family protein [Kangiella sp. HZ709]|uniref:aspartate aminotransferase family protein n=1 Tax=Kangiella sp. HZ709 TaxID=2666328 RepID=UPI0012B0B8D2|nr:aspartate aminotransferase family protein [Kangiella sp. HZ709]MRX28452.1 acetylornithine/succinylornithine family transaminase [Kangiella sp. HZ709]
MSDNQSPNSSSKYSRATFDEVMVPNYNPASIIPERGEGSKVWDQNGKDYIDFAGGIAVTALGHNHPGMLKALKEQSEKIWHLSNVFTNKPALELAQKLTDATFADKVFFCNSGGEANEAAFKLVRKYANDNYPDQGKSEIVAFKQAFHGRTLFTVCVGGQPKYTHGYEPLPQGISHGEFNNIEALEGLINDKTCAVVMEPVQGEGGIIPADPEFAKAVRELCDKHNALLVFDEVQTGVGRTGHLYAYQGLGVTPDILTTAKAMGGGFPIGAMLTTTKISKSMGVGTHGSTYGGNPLACAISNVVIDEINTPEMLNGVKEKSAKIKARLESIGEKYDVFETVRGEGLLIGAVCNEKWQGKAREFLVSGWEHGVMCLVAGLSVVRFAPALNITNEEIDLGLDRFEKAVAAIA